MNITNSNNTNSNHYYNNNDLIIKTTNQQSNTAITTRQKIPLKAITVNNSKLKVDDKVLVNEQHQTELLNVLYPIHVRRSSDGESNKIPSTTIKSTHLSFLSTNSQIFKPPPNVTLFSNSSNNKKSTSKKKL